MTCSANPPYIEMCFHPTIELISTARRLVRFVYSGVLDADAAERASMVAHELLENALKYSPDGQTTIRIKLSHPVPPLTLSVETENRIADENRQPLDAAFSAMNGRTDATEFYLSAMRAAGVRKHGSGLGLARIWAEGEMKVTHRYEGERVWITASARIEEKQS